MIDHDKNVGQMLKLLDELGIAENTFVMYSTDNGPHRNTWPDGGMTPFRSEKNTNWEGAFRIPLLGALAGQDRALVRSPTASCSITTGCRPSSPWPVRSDVVDKLKSGYRAIGRTYKNHIDGYNLLPYLTGQDQGEPAQLLLLLQ